MHSIPVADITSEAFAPYGDLLAVPATPPRQDRAGRMENTRPDAVANLALVRSDPFDRLKPLCRLERHPHSNQAFLPLSVEGYVVVVAPDRHGSPDEARIQAFRVPGRVGINYRAGAWHAHMMTLCAPGTFAMLVHEDGTAADCDFASIAPVSLDMEHDA
ncbi:ureidoglycolate lyase [Methylobacterium sp. NEAU K]|uniref:ureidoglycolate lyase n=1 Tax=Methylobacterium sp. NEAU K TaxID=3064946 RepID=UPI0027370645|nr:ureidoglycolate lyase [Methylobacterium sp. NEAU K]MDP4002634.1 ureidoglycolate lyase [Methylobacterium sp. NEAU K]